MYEKLSQTSDPIIFFLIMENKNLTREKERERIKNDKNM